VSTADRQGGLFTVPAARPRPVRQPPVVGVRWRQRRGAGRDDCAACWAAQSLAAAAGRPVPRRRSATWVREEDRDTGRRGYSGSRSRPARTLLCQPHRVERQLADIAGGGR